jgi:subtilisin family serine protease
LHKRVRLLVLAVAAVATLAFASSAFAQTYVVLYKQQAVPAGAATAIQKAGGTLVASYDQIGVAIASSNATAFRDNLLKDAKVENASGTADFGVKLKDNTDISLMDAIANSGNLPNAPATDSDSLSGLQWDMRQIHTPEAHAITGGSPAVLVGDIDTGIDFTHPDLIQNIDVANSANCLSGAAVPGVAAQDDNGHGTHTAGTIAAASNGFGIVGVAPNVKIAGIKAGGADGYFFPQAVICAFIWAGTHHMDVTNNSYFADPYEYNCRNDPVQRAIWKAEQRAIMFAEKQGVTVVAAEGNDADDLAHPTGDVTSPDYPPGTAENREITNACVVIPVEIPGVIGVTATGDRRQVDKDDDPNDYLKAYYSNFGVGVTQVTAPGGDYYFGDPPGPFSLVLSTWPAALAANCQFLMQDMANPAGNYCYEQGTSMASPHAAGVAALIISQFGNTNSPQNGKMRPEQVKAYLDQTADPQPCPTELPDTPLIPGVNYLVVTGTNSGAVQQCQGGPGYNSWYGNGQVNAFNAVTHSSGN